MHEDSVYKPCWSPDGKLLVTCSADFTIKALTSDKLGLLDSWDSQSEIVYEITMSPDGRLIASASADKTVRIWNLAKGTETAILEGHTASVLAVQFSPDGDILASASPPDFDDPESIAGEVRLWRCRGWEPVASLSRRGFDGIGGLAFHPSQPLLAIKDRDARQIDCYSIDYALLGGTAGEHGSRRYGNAKVVLIGDTGVGKSGLGLVLSGQPYKATDSTHGRNVWTLDAEEVEVPGGVCRPERFCSGI